MRALPRVAVLGINFPPEPTGIAPYTGGLAFGLRRRGFPVRVVTAHPHYPEWSIWRGYGQWKKREHQQGVPILRLRHYVPRRPKGFSRLLSELSFGARIGFARLGRPDIVVCVSPALFSTAIALTLSRLIGRRAATVIWVQDLYSLGMTETGAGGRGLSAFMAKIEGRTLRAADGVVVIHQRFANYVIEKLGVAPERVKVIRNWTHLQPPRAPLPERLRARFGWRDDETVVLHAGNMGAKQALENVIQAARLADDQGAPVRFVLVGAGSERAALIASATDVRRVQILDPLDDDDFQAALLSADVLLVNEKAGVSEMAVPSKLTSYFNSGRPVIAATDPMGITAEEIRVADAGLVVPAETPAELLNAATMLGRDKALASRLGTNGQRFRADVLDEETAINSYAELLIELAAKRGH